MTNFMPGYKLHAHARRASIQFVTAPSIVGVDYRHQHKFSREISDGLPLEKTPPLSPAWKDWLAGALIFVIFIGSIITVWT